MVNFNLDEEVKYSAPLILYMDYILLNYNKFLKNNLDINVTPREFLYLFHISYLNRVSQKELAELMYVSEANVTKIIKKLEKKEYIERCYDENNKSRKLVSLSVKGEKLVEQLTRLTGEWENKLSQSYDNEKIEEIKDFLYDLSENSVNNK